VFDLMDKLAGHVPPLRVSRCSVYEYMNVGL